MLVLNDYVSFKCKTPQAYKQLMFILKPLSGNLFSLSVTEKRLLQLCNCKTATIKESVIHTCQDLRGKSTSSKIQKCKYLITLMD